MFLSSLWWDDPIWQILKPSDLKYQQQENELIFVNILGVGFPALPETNIFAPENGWLEYDRFFLGWYIFRGELLDLLVSGRVWVFPKIGKHPKMDGENNGKPY